MQCLGKLPAALWVLDLAWHRILQNAGLLERNAIVAEAGHEVTPSLTLHAHVIVLMRNHKIIASDICIYINIFMFHGCQS